MKGLIKSTPFFVINLSNGNFSTLCETIIYLSRIGVLAIVIRKQEYYE